MQNESDREREIEEEFDRYIRQEIFNASNEYRREHGLPLLSEGELDELSEPEDSNQPKT